MVPLRFCTEIKKGKYREDSKGDYLLYNFKLIGGVKRTAPSVRWHHNEVLKKGDSPTDENCLPKGNPFVFQMAIPSKGHKDIAHKEEK